MGGFHLTLVSLTASAHLLEWRRASRIIDLTTQLTSKAYLRNPLTGTHLIAPAYAFKGGRTVDQLSPEGFVTDAVLLDLTRKRPGEVIDDEDMEAAEEDAGLAVREGEAAILHITQQPQKRTPRKHAFLSENAAQYFEFKRVGMVGIDAASLGPGTRPSTAHKILLRSGISVLEGLCNLDQIEVERFRLVAPPVKVKASVSPVRALALVTTALTDTAS